MDPKKSTYPLMSESGAEYSWYGLSDNLKETLLGFMDGNDLAESSFSSVTSQMQVFGRIGMSSATNISDIDSNVFLYRNTTNRKISYKKTSMFHDFS